MKLLANGRLMIAVGVFSMAYVAPLHAQPSAMGEWSAILDWPVEAVHATLLPTGKVMIWQTWTESVGLWDPLTLQFSAADLPLHNPFCSGHAWLADGRLLVAGGHIATAVGEHRANIYNPFTNTWADNVPNMPNAAPDKNGRWYPSATTLGNGDVLVMAGDMDGDGDSNDLPQIYQASTNTWRNLTGARKVLPYYPRTFLAPDGNVYSVTNYDGTERISFGGTGSWTHVANPPENDYWNYIPAVMYEPGKIALLGSGDPSPNVILLDATVANPTWTFNSDTMAQPRRQHNATILADGTVLITGGTSAAGSNNNDPAGKVTIPELWDPKTGEITQVAGASNIYRGYHSTALLLPDGSVLSAGGDHDDPNFISNLNAEIYRPAYLFKGPRPTVTSAPASAPLGRTFFVATPDAADINGVTAAVPGSATHAQNWTQRINHLDFTEVPGGLAITLPSNMNEMPLGYYMLFLINSNGVPSMANWVQALAPTPGLPGDFNLDNAVDAADYIAWRKGLGPAYSYGDYVDWQRNFGKTGGGAGGWETVVPEPSTAALWMLGLLAAAGRRITHRGRRRA